MIHKPLQMLRSHNRPRPGDPRSSPTGRLGRLLARLATAAVFFAVLAPPLAHGEDPPAKIAILTTLAGVDEAYGRSFVDSARLAVEEANRSGSGPRLVIETYDDRGEPEAARAAAEKIVASDAQVVLGPLLSTSSLTAGPVFAKAGIASIVSTAESDLITDNATTFRAVFKNGDIGEWLASYLHHALGGTRAVILFIDNGYGRTIADGFRRGAERLGMPTVSYGFSTEAGRDEAARRAAAEPGNPAIMLAMLDADSAATVMTLKRLGVAAPLLGGTGVVEDAFSDLFKDQPEERRQRGFFARNVYGAIPVLLDSANAETLAFAERLRVRFGANQPPASWASVQGYDAARLGIAAVLQAARATPGASLAARRDLARKHLASLDGPSRAVPGLLGPLWFTPDRGRSLPIRIGRFSEGRFESAPLQLVPVSRPSAEEIASGELVEIGTGHYARRQQVVYTGIYLNEVSRIDIAQATFTADLYVWVRFARGVTAAEADPTQIVFPTLVRGSFDSRQPVAHRDFEDGTTYRLWRVSGEFKNDFYLQRYPADRQTLGVRFFNARAASDRLVYVLDRSGFDPLAADGLGNGAAAAAFRNLTQWEPQRVVQGRDNLVTQSGLGDPALVGLERVRELSGFNLRVDVHRLIGTTLIKTLLPIGLMTLIMFATLYFPPGLAAAKVTVAITAGLSGAVLLSAINSQLGNVGYVIAVEYGFYVFFALCLLCILTVLVAEKMRLAGLPGRAAAVERSGRYVFLAAFLATVLAALVALEQWS